MLTKPRNRIFWIFLLLLYSLGLGLPFFVCSLALNTFLSVFQKARRYIGVFTKVGGFLLIIVAAVTRREWFHKFFAVFFLLYSLVFIGINLRVLN